MSRVIFTRMIKQCGSFGAILVVLIFTGMLPMRLRAADFGPLAAGARGGIGIIGSSTDFREAEVFLDWKLPVDWDLGRDCHLSMFLDSSAGWLGESGDSAAILQLGPAFKFGQTGFPLEAVLGCNPTYISQHDFPAKDLGCDMQFTTYIGVNLKLMEHLEIGCRYQHLSNAGLSSRNPGLNLVLFSVGYSF